jgi:soluble calcium-activated nucleotidase 1
MWCKTLEPAPSWALAHVDTRPQYKGLRAAAICPQGAGYMIHESGRWSDEHKMWFFAPRKLSRQPYDEVVDASKCVNLMLAAPEPLPEDGTGVIMQSYLGFSELRGCSDFIFVPGTHDCHVFMIRTEETLDNVISTYASVIDLEGKILMAETLIARARKFEGVCNLGGFQHFEGECAPATAGECVVS